jgi:hypothetical protein
LASYGRRGAPPVSVGTILLLIILAFVSQTPTARGATTSSSSSSSTTSTSSLPANVSGGISIDQQQFLATVPSYAVLGTNYTVRVVIQSNVDIVVPIIVQMSAPVGAIFFHPRVVRTSVPPMGSVVTNFTILPFAPPRTGPYNVTALLFVFFPLSMSSPQLVEQVTATVSTIGPNPFPYLGLVLISAAVVALVLIAVFYRDIPRKGASGPPR